MDLHLEDSDADLAQALEQNSFVTDIELVLWNVQTANWRDLLRVIATRANLERMKLLDAFYAEDRNAPPALVSAILRSIRQNPAIRTVHLICLHLPTDISTFLDIASSITALLLLKCDIMAPSVEREQGTRDLAAALQRNTNIKTLDLRFLDDIYAIPIVQGLRSNVSLTTFAIGCDSFSDATTRAIQQLLESTTSIQAFELMFASFRRRRVSPCLHKPS